MTSLVTRHTSPVTRRLSAAFTLVELLVVIAIVAILAGLGFSGVNAALETGKKAQARNDTQQILGAIRAYQLEYGRLPSKQTDSDQYMDDNSELMKVLLGQEDTDLNPRKIPFIQPKVASGPKGGFFEGKFYDPWGKPYIIEMDTDYSGQINGWYGSPRVFAPAIVISSGSDMERGPTYKQDVTSF